MLYPQVFIATHRGSGASMLIDMVLASHRMGRIRRYSDQVYSDPTFLLGIQKTSIQYQKNARVFVDKLMFNHELMHRQYYHMGSYLFVVREAEGTLNSLVESGSFTPKAALRYYCYRLRRLCEMAKKIPRKLVVSWDELVDKSCFPKVKKFLALKELTSIYRPEILPRLVDQTLVFEGQRSYERYLGYLRAISLSH